MKIDLQDGTVVEGNIDTSDEIPMLISAAAMPHIAKILTTLYNDPQSAVFREYLANALDAHTVSGIDSPVDIYLPTRQTPMFTVKDHGCGMSRHIIKTVYSQYGVSTKMSNNDEIGGFGLGCKSALAIASQFTLISIHNGVRVTAIVSNSEDGVSKVNIVDEQETEEPNGTSVAIPINDPESFSRKARAYFPYLAQGTIRIDGVDLNKPHYEMYEEFLMSKTELDAIDTTVYTYDTRWLDRATTAPPSDEFVLVMGGIRYSIPKNDIRANLDEDSISYAVFTEVMSRHVVMECPIGSVKLSPQREGIQFNEATKAFFNSVFDEMSHGVIEALEKSIDEAKTFIDALETYKQMTKDQRKFVPNKWNGLTLNASGLLHIEGATTASYVAYADKCDYSEPNTFNLTAINKVLTLVTGDVPSKSFSRYAASYIKSTRSTGNYHTDITYVGAGLKATLTAYKDREWAPAEPGKAPDRIFDALSPDELATVLEGVSYKVVDFETMKAEAIKYRKEQNALLPKEQRIKKATSYAVLFADNTYRFKPLSEMEFDDDVTFLYLSGVTQHSHNGMFSVAARITSDRISNMGGNSYMTNLIKEAYGNFALITITGTRKTDTMLKSLKSLDITDIKELDIEALYAKKIKEVESITEQELRNYIFHNESYVKNAGYVIERVKDRELSKVLNRKKIQMVGKALEVYNRMPSTLTNSMKGAIVAYEKASYWDWQNSDLHEEISLMRKDLLTKYPLLSQIKSEAGISHGDEIVEYMNAKHRKSKHKLFTSLG